jgi:C4-dicarboxylate-binding protein DctP
MNVYKLLIGLLITGLVVSVQAKDQPIVIKFSHIATSDTPKGKAAERFKELAEKYTNNKVKVEVYPNSQLFKDKDEMDALLRGEVQMLAPSLSKLAPLGIKEFEIFDLPYIFNDYKDMHTVTQGQIGKDLFSRLEPKGIVGLAYWDNAFKQMSANKPLRKLEDFKSLKMRIQASKIIELQMQALGATPVITSFAEARKALQTGVADGTENSISNFFTQNIHEVQKFLTLTNHGYLGYAVIANKRFWDKLPDDVKDSLNKAMMEATDYANEIAKKENDDALTQVKASGKTEVIELTPDEKAALKKAMITSHDKQTIIPKVFLRWWLCGEKC